MELKSKDIQDYLNKHNISTYGLVGNLDICLGLIFILSLFYTILEKRELVDLFCKKHIPEKPKKGMEKLTANFAGSLPNLRPLNDLIGKSKGYILCY